MAVVQPSAHDQVERPSDFNEKGTAPGEGDYKRWKSEVERAIKHFEKYHERVDRIIKKYRTEEEASKTSKKAGRKYNVLWSIVSTLQPNLFMGMPKPYVSRRFSDKDKVARAGAMILERCLTYVNDSDDMADAFSGAVDDYILGARGTVWTRYSPEFDLRLSEKKNYYANDNEVPKEGVELGKDDQGSFYQETYDKLTHEECETDHISIPSFLHAPASSWKQVPWCAKRVLMNRTELQERFKEQGKLVPLRYKPSGERAGKKDLENAESEGLYHVACVWEIWDKPSKSVIWLCLEHDRILDQKEDPLKLKGFFPTPRPLYDTTTSNTLVPVPMFKYFEDIAYELDELTFRISLLTEAMRVVGCYDATHGDTIQRMMTETRENQLIKVKNWAAMIEQGGLKGAIAFLPIEQIITVIEKLYGARQQLLTELYEITGISDIIRGSTDPRETAKAQQIKGQYASKRLLRRQKSVARFAREHLEIQAEIICKHYDDETILKISSAQEFLTDEQGNFDQGLFAAALKLLRVDPLRCYRIKIDNETLAGDDLKEQNQNVVAFLSQFGQLMSAAFPLAQQAPPLAHALKEMTMMAVRSFPIARSVEGAIEAALEKMANNMPPPEDKAAGAKQGPSPEEIQIKLKELSIREQELGIKRQELLLKEKEMEMRFKLDMARAQSDAALRDKQINTLRENVHETNVIKLKEGAAQRDHDTQKHGAEIADRQQDREMQDRHHAEGQEVEVTRTAADIAERRLDREDRNDDAAETRTMADKHHSDKIEVTREAAKAKAKQQPSK